MTSSWNDWNDRRKMAAIAAAALLATGLMGCEPPPPIQAQAAQIAKPLQPAAPTPREAATPPPPTPTISATPVSPAPLTRPPQDPVSDTMLYAMASAYDNLEGFEGLLTLTTDPGTPAATTTTMRQSFRRPNIMKLQVVRSEGHRVPVGTALVFDGRALFLYDSESDHVVRMEDEEQMTLFLNLPQERIHPLLQVLRLRHFVSTAAAEAIVTMGGADMVVDRPTTIVDVTPEAPTPRQGSARLWLHDRTKVPLRGEMFAPGGRILLSFEYLQFDPTPPKPEDSIAFTPPTVNTTEATPPPEEIPSLAGFREATPSEALNRTGLPLRPPKHLPAGHALRSVHTGSFAGSPVAVQLYGTANTVATTVTERPAGLLLPVFASSSTVPEGDIAAEIQEVGEMVVMEWVRGDTAYTLVSTLPREGAMEIARSIR